MKGTALVAATLALAAWGSAHAQTGKIFVEVREAEAQQKGDDACVGPWCNEQDFWAQVSFPPFTTWLKTKEIGNRDHPSWIPVFTVSEDVSKTQRYHDIKIELWDKDDSTADDRFDITPLPTEELNLHFDACKQTYEQIGLASTFGPGVSNPPFGTRDPEFNGRVVIDAYTEGHIPFTTNDISIVDLSPVQVSFDPDKVVSGKATAMKIVIASTYTDATPEPAPIHITVSDGTSAWTETRAVTIPAGLSTFYFFDGKVVTSQPFVPIKPPNTDIAFITYSATVDYNDIAPSGTAPDFIDCYQDNNSVFNKQTELVRTSGPDIVFVPFDFLDSLSNPTYGQVQAMAQRDEQFRRVTWPLASTSHVVSPIPLYAPWFPQYPVTWFSEPYLMLTVIGIAAKLSFIDRMVLVPRKGWFAANVFRSFIWPGGSIGLSLGEVGPHAVLAEEGYYAVSTHELGHTFKLSRHKCSNGGFKEDVLGLGCRDEYSGDFIPADGVPFFARGLDVEGAIFPSGTSDSGSFACAAPRPGTREVCLKNLMDSQTDTGFVNWTDTFTLNYLTDTLRQQGDPEIVNLSGWVHSLNGFPTDAPPNFEGELMFSYHTLGTPDLPEPARSELGLVPSGEGRFMVTLRTDLGDKIYRFTPALWSEGEVAPREGGYFSFFVPWDPSTRAVVLTAPVDVRDTDCEDRSCADVILFERAIQPLPPAVSALRAGKDVAPPLSGPEPPAPTIGPGHDAVIAWSAADATPGPEGLHAVLLLSPRGPAGGPAQWLPFVFDSPDTEVRIPHDRLAATPGDYLGQVIVSNGLLSTPYTSSMLMHICNDSNSGVERCDGLDNDCDGTIDDALPPPGTSVGSISSAEFSWTVNLSADVYDAVRGDAAALRSTGGDFAQATRECLASGTPATSTPFAGDPLPGEAWWFLVRGRNCVAAGTWDEPGGSQVGSRDAGINASPNGCR